MENYLLNSSKSLFELDFYVIYDLLLKVTLLYAEWVDGPVAWVDDAVLRASSHDGMVDWEAGVFGNVQLPAELSDKRQTHRSHLDERGEGGERGRLRGMQRGMKRTGLPCLCFCSHTHTHTREKGRKELEWNRCRGKMKRATGKL